MSAAPFRSVLIVGGGLAGWMSAVALAKLLSPRQFKIRIVDTASADLDALDGGEAGLPAMAELHALLGLYEAEFLRETGAVFSLGTAFTDWPRKGARSFRPFGDIGARLDGLAFHHYWLRLRAAGDKAELSDYALGAAAAQREKFAPPVRDRRSVLSTLDYAYHWPGAAYLALLRSRAERQGVVRVAGEIAGVKLRGIEGALKSGFEDWRRWLPCDRAIAVRHGGRTGSRAVPHGGGRRGGLVMGDPAARQRRRRPRLRQRLHGR